MPNCHICKKSVTSGLVVCGECAKGNEATNFDCVTESPAALAKLIAGMVDSEWWCPAGAKPCKPDSDCKECWIDWLNKPSEKLVKERSRESEVAT